MALCWNVFQLNGKYGFLFDVVKQESTFKRSYISMLFLYVNGMLTTPNELRNMYQPNHILSLHIKHLSV
jgi:hypothetical protein